jgi:hypothetical protein
MSILSNYVLVKAKQDASLIGKSGLLVEFYDNRHFAAAFFALNGTMMVTLSL